MSWRQFLALCRGLGPEAAIFRFAGEADMTPEGQREACEAFFSQLMGG